MTKSKKSLQLIRNAMQTPDGTILESQHVHDYVAHTDANGKIYVLDGGLSYVRSSFNGDEVYMTLYDNEPHEIQREVLTWGTYGKNGDEPLRRVKIADMETAHIAAVLTECFPCDVLKAAMVKELEFRDEHRDN